MSGIDLNGVRLGDKDAPQPPRKKSPGKVTPPRHKRGEKFLKGPIPWVWIVKAGKLGGKALTVGIAIWQIAGMVDDRRVSISLTKISNEFGFDRSSASRALSKLEKNGLVAVYRLTGKNPEVEILDPDPE